MGNTPAPDVRVRLSAEGQLEVMNAFKQIQAQAEATGRIGSRGLDALSRSTASLARLLPSMTFAAVVAGAVTMAKRALETADGFAKLSQRTGVSVEDLSRYAHGAELAGLETEDLAKGLARLSRNMYLAAQGGAQQLSAFQRVGISQKELQTGTITLDQALGRIAGRLASLPDGWQKSAEAQALFGKTGDRMLPFLNQGPEGLARISAEAERLHLVMSTKTALAAEQFNDALKRLRGTAEGLIYQELAALLPQLSEFTVKLGLLNLEIAEWKLRLESAGLAAAGAVEALIPFHGDKARGFFAMATDAASEAMRVQMKWNAELSAGLSRMAALGREAKKRDGAAPPVTDEAARGKALDAGKRLADAELALKRTQLENELALVKAHNAATSTEEQARFKEGLAGVQNYFADRRAMLEYEAKKEAQILQKETEEIQKRMDAAAARPLKQGEPEASRQAEVVKLQEELAKVQTKAQVQGIALAGQRAQMEGEEREAVRQFNVERLNADAQLLDAQGQRFAAERAELDAQIAGMKRLAEETDVAFAERRAKVWAAGEAKIQFEQLQAKASAAFAGIESQRTGIEAQVQRGMISELDGQEQIAALEKGRLPALEAIAAAMTAAAVTPEQIEAARQFSDQLVQLAASSDLAGQRMADFKKSVSDALTSDLANWLSSGIDQAQGLGDAFRGLALSVVQSIRQIVSQMLAAIVVAQAWRAILGFAGMGGGGQAPAGGAPIFVAEGGLVRGPGTGTSDSIPARLSAGEYVVRAAAVREVGIQFMEDLNSFSTTALRPLGRLRAFATGGLVDGDTQKTGRSRLEAQLTLNDALVLERLAASRDFSRVVVKVIGDHRRAVKGLLR